MKMNRVIGGLLALALLAFAGNAMALQFKIQDGPGSLAPPLTWNGGSFGLDIGANGSVDYLTFCLERNETIRLNFTYDGTYSNSAVNGGIAGGSPDPISEATAWLYNTFLFNPTYFGVMTEQKYVDLQLAFWRLENELTTLPSYAVYASQYINDANANAKQGEFYNVKVVNLTQTTVNSDGQRVVTQRQSMLAVPEPGTLLLLGSGLLGLGLLRRRREF